RPSSYAWHRRKSSVTAELNAWTVTQGSTLPDVSRATPAIPLACCADAAGAKARPNARAPAIRNPGFVHFIESLLDRDRWRCTRGVVVARGLLPCFRRDVNDARKAVRPCWPALQHGIRRLIIDLHADLHHPLR